MLVTDKRTTNKNENARGITSITVNRTSSLREQRRPEAKEDQISGDNDSLVLNKRSLSNDKISSEPMVPVSLHQRGSSLRHNGKTAFPISSPHSNNHHEFKIIKPIDTSPRISEGIADNEAGPVVKSSSQRLKFKHRGQIPFQGGPLIPDHNLMKDPPRENIVFTPRPPLVKRFSSDQDETNSDIDNSVSLKNPRPYQIASSAAPKPPMSPSRGCNATAISHANTATCSLDKNEKQADTVDEDTSEMEDIPNSDCESPTPPNNPIETSRDTKQRSSLRKGSDSPYQSDVGGRGSPSPTKTVKWNLNADVKKIPRSRSLNGKYKPSKSKSSKSGSERFSKFSAEDQKLMESHEIYIGSCTTLMKHHMSLIENLRHDRITTGHYKKDLSELLEYQKKLVVNLQNILADMVLDQEVSSPGS